MSRPSLESMTKEELIVYTQVLEATAELWKQGVKTLLAPAPRPYVGYERVKKEK